MLHYSAAYQHSQAMPTMIRMNYQVGKCPTKGKVVATTSWIVNRSRCCYGGVACGMPKHEQAIWQDVFEILLPVCVADWPAFLFKQRIKRLFIADTIGTKFVANGEREL